MLNQKAVIAIKTKKLRKRFHEFESRLKHNHQGL
jgi:hypothetical protein